MRNFGTLLTAAICLLLARGAMAQDCGGTVDECCGTCGSNKVCKVVCETKKVKKTVWVVECEEFCPSLPNCCRARKSCGGDCQADCGEEGCGGKDCCDPCASLRRPMVPPKCGKVRTRKKLVKKQITCEVPVYKCVVVCCEPSCAASCGGCGDEAPAHADPGTTERTTRAAPQPPILGTSYLKSLILEP